MHNVKDSKINHFLIATTPSNDAACIVIVIALVIGGAAVFTALIEDAIMIDMLLLILAIMRTH